VNDEAAPRLQAVKTLPGESLTLLRRPIVVAIRIEVDISP
jgi:hypothetical protein